MKTILAGSLVALGLVAAAPVMAQGVYVGPNGVGVDTGLRPYGYGYNRGYDRGYDRRVQRDRGFYEGRSAYRGDRRHDY